MVHQFIEHQDKTQYLFLFGLDVKISPWKFIYIFMKQNMIVEYSFPRSTDCQAHSSKGLIA